jgi:Flp pilus assembly protein TadB
MSEENNESDIKNQLESLEERLDSIEQSLKELLTKLEESSERSEIGYLLLGLVLSCLASFSINIWTDYYILTADPPGNFLILSLISIFMFAVFGVLTWMAFNLLKKRR